MTLREYVAFKAIADDEQEEPLAYADDVDL